MDDNGDLLPGEAIVCRSPEGIILTSDGWVALHKTHRHKGLTQIFKLLNLRDVESIELLPKVDSLRGKATLAARIVYAILLLAAMALFAISPFSYGSDAFLNGLDPSLCEDLDGDYRCQQTSWVKDSPLWLKLPGLALIAMIAQYGLRFPFGSSVVINHGEGKMHVKQESLEVMEVSFVFSFFWSFMLMPSPGDGFLQGDSPFIAAVLVAFPVGAVLWNSMKREISLSDSAQEEEQEEGYAPFNIEDTPQVSLVEFYHHLRAPLGLEGEADGVEEVRPVQEEMSEEIESIKRKLEDHNDLLLQIVANYPDMFRGVSPWQGVSSVRASAERILSYRLHRILPNPSKEVKVLSQYRDQLKKWDPAFGNEIILTVDVIINLGNAATHNMTGTKADYLSALEKFVALVEWHMENPAVPKS